MMEASGQEKGTDQTDEKQVQGIVEVKQRLHDAAESRVFAACAVIEPQQRHGQEDAQL